MIYSKGRLFSGQVEFDDSQILDVQEGDDHSTGGDRCLIMPLLVNCHSHVGDACLRGRVDGKSLDELVAPPDGLKHRWLSECTDQKITESMGRAIEEMRLEGVRAFVDFREGGLNGLRQFHRAVESHKLPSATVLSRPKELEYREHEVDELLAHSDGIGVSAVSDWNYEDLLGLSNHAHEKEKLFSLHASEGRREDISKILDLKPDFIVHMAKATDEDLAMCHERNVPVVVCPRSNRRFGIDIDISRMIDLGLDICLGTDNSMFHHLSLVEEMRAALSSESNSRPLDPAEVIKLAVENPEKVLRDKTKISIRPGSRCQFMVLRAGDIRSPIEILTKNVDYTIELISR